MTRRPTTLAAGILAAALPLALAPSALARVPADAAAPTGHAAKTYRLSADPSGALRFTRSRITAARGSVTLRMANPSPGEHAIAIRGRSGAIVDTGGVSRVTVKLKAGSYTYYCPVGDHRAAGMAGRLTVR
jgi:plastocyanin